MLVTFDIVPFVHNMFRIKFISLCEGMWWVEGERESVSCHLCRSFVLLLVILSQHQDVHCICDVAAV